MIMKINGLFLSCCLYLGISLIQSCSPKKCQEDFLGTLCYESKSTESKIDVYMDGKKIVTLDTLEKYCIDEIRAGNHTYVRNFVRLAGGAGSLSAKTVFIPACEKITVEIYE